MNRHARCTHLFGTVNSGVNTKEKDNRRKTPLVIDRVKLFRDIDLVLSPPPPPPPFPPLIYTPRRRCSRCSHLFWVHVATSPRLTSPTDDDSVFVVATSLKRRDGVHVVNTWTQPVSTQQLNPVHTYAFRCEHLPRCEHLSATWETWESTSKRFDGI